MNLFDLFVKIGVKDEASDKLPGIADKLKGGLATAGKVAAAGIGAATAAVAALTKASVEGYAETEQLRGGVETLFKTSADTVMAYAENAYKTAGMSANEYMNTVTSFSASLLQSLGGDTEEAAKKADQAITDMADNANKMGTDMSMIQNAYNGFAKQNYTMLDNLKLGYGGTKEEMQRLLDKADELNAKQGIYTDYQIDSYADIVDAIHVVQTEMGITGTTAAEAEKTISGSAAAMKSAWTNLVAGLADENANVGELLATFLGTVETTAGNILPVVKNVLSSIGNMLIENAPEMIANGALLLGKLAVGAIQAIPGIVAKIPEIVRAIVLEFKKNGPEFKQIGKDIVMGLWNGISALASWLKSKVSDFVGGIVSNVKGVLGIHSPSRVFAGIGENMALGLGEGWDNEYGAVKNSITTGLDFGTSNIDVKKSGVWAMTHGNGNTLDKPGNPITIVVQSVLDGKVIGETSYKYGQDLERAYGGA